MARMDARAFPFRLPADAHPNVERLIEHNHRRCAALAAAGGARPVQSVGIVGAGLMGTAVAAASLSAGLNVVVHDVDRATRDRAAENTFVHLTAQGRVRPYQAERLLDEHLSVSDRLDDVARCDLVLESIIERPEVKRDLYAELEPMLADRAVLATNTSTIPIEQLAAELCRPERFCGLHFFHPVAERPLVEVVRGPRTSIATVAAAISYARSIGKMALVVRDGPGFVVNRLLLPYLTEAVELLSDGASVERVESVATAFGMAKGPLALLDEIGLDTAIAGGRVLWQAFPHRVAISPLLIAMYKAGRLGVKSGAGFYRYDESEREDKACHCLRESQERGDMSEGTACRKAWRHGKTANSADPDGMERLPRQAVAHTGVDPVALEKIAQWSRTPQTLNDADILDRMLLPMVVEATRLLEEKNVDDPRDVDLGVLFGLGFPLARGGLLRWADTQRAAEILARLGRLNSLGPRSEPTALLRRMAAEGRPFYAPPLVPVHEELFPSLDVPSAKPHNEGVPEPGL